MNDILQRLTVKVFVDCADLPVMLAAREKYPFIRGFTTNPTLLAKAGVRDYALFCKHVAQAIPDLPVSLEVVADDEATITEQARKIAGLGDNLYVKIPVTNTRGKSLAELAGQLSREGVKVNVTAVFTPEQAGPVCEALDGGAPAFLSLFCGRIADTGNDPVLTVQLTQDVLVDNVDLIWASTRQVFDVLRADAVGCNVITVTPDILDRLDVVGRDLEQYSLETVRQFYMDAQKAGLRL